MSFTKAAYALALGWDEIGPIEEVRPGWTNEETFSDWCGRCDMVLLKAGESAYYANCQRAAARLGTPSWATWQQGPLACSPLSDGLLLSELMPGPPPNYGEHGTFSDFWRVVDDENRFVWVIRLDAVGDLLLTLGYLRAFKDLYPGRRIGMIVRDCHVPWVQQADWLDAICGVDIVYWERLNREAPADDGRSAWINLMPGMLRVAGNRLIAERGGPRASAYPDASTPCEFSPKRHVTGQRELHCAVFEGLQPVLPVRPKLGAVNGAIWFSPYPGVDERLWPPSSWVAALQPLAGRPMVMQPAHSALEESWEAEFLRRAGNAGLRLEVSKPTRTIFDLAQEMSGFAGWVGINSAPMHVAGLLGLPSLGLGLPWERNAMWNHPRLQIIAAEEYAQTLLEKPSKRSLQAFARDTDRADGWADGMYLRPEEFAKVLQEHILLHPSV